MSIDTRTADTQEAGKAPSTGRVAVVTGGAAGIGQAFARRLAQDGHTVAVADLAPAHETLGAIGQVGAEASAGHCDVSEAESVQAYAQDIKERHGGADILVHCAGIYPIAPFLETDWATWRRIMGINLDSLFHLTQAFLPGMVEKGWGRVIVMASTTFHNGTPGLTAYTASKGGVIGFVRSLAGEVGAMGVTVNAIAPSIVDTPGTQAGPQREMGIFDMLEGAQAIKRTQTPEDLVGAASFLASEDSAFMTGQTMIVDGGWVRT